MKVRPSVALLILLLLNQLLEAACLAQLAAHPPSAKTDVGNPNPIVFRYRGVVANHLDVKQIQYAATNNTDSARGNAPLAAVAAARNGDHLDLSPGVFDIGTSNIVLSLSGGGVFHLHGAGKTRTIISRTSGANAIVVPGSNSQTTDLTLFADAPASTMSSWGHFGGTADILDAWLHSVCISNWADGILFGADVKITAHHHQHVHPPPQAGDHQPG